jgi:ABC-type branched-subunit amino acid transport system substrate-binding protein
MDPTMILFRGLMTRLKRRARSSEPRSLVTIPGFLRRHWIANSLIVVVLLIGLIYLVQGPKPPQGPKTCGRGMTVTGGSFNECVGVTDGAASFPPELGLQTVLGKIKKENDTVMGKGVPFVSIGYVVPLPRDDTKGLLTALRHELEGAYLAQWRANQHDEGLGDTPLIRLLVVNVGDQAGQQAAVIPEVIQRATDPTEHLVAVAGLGQSLEATKLAIRTLSDAGIPMIASRLTADDLSTVPGQPVPGLYRIPATNSAEAIAAAQALKSKATLLVQDINQGDAYTKSLAEQFRKAFAAPLLEPEQYNSSLPAVANTFVQMMPSICTEKPAAIYYAGRGANLPDFLAALAGRRCQQLKIDLFTGDDAVDLTATLRQQLAAGDQDRIAANLRTTITLRYTALAHPDAWTNREQFLPASTKIFQGDCAATNACFTRDFPGERLDDGAAIVGYDALLVATHAIRSGVIQPGDTPGGPAALTHDAGAVLQGMLRINLGAPVAGASGLIAFDEKGKPIDKPIPILELEPDGVKFIGLG